MCHCYVRSDGLVGVCVSDEEYQTRVAHSLITKILDDFAGQGGIQEFSSFVFTSSADCGVLYSDFPERSARK